MRVPRRVGRHSISKGLAIAIVGPSIAAAGQLRARSGWYRLGTRQATDIARALLGRLRIALSMGTGPCIAYKTSISQKKTQ